jgi:bifunctional DNA-binding transcriptional regulator/antitoxin component of YhaV-PrlF toxin-antitoxin module
MITTVTGKNQVTVPAALASEEGIKPGTRLEWARTDREHVVEVRILPSTVDLARDMRGRGKRRPGSTLSAVEGLIREREQDELDRSGG